ncbi:MAG: hypothetical protein HYT07_00285 [Candidatus Levybacteria bacterium]|nr:hypothetical protein [Candidatus Levybacteria bacterium]
MDESSEEVVEDLRKPESLEGKVFLVKKAFGVASKHFEAREGKENPRYSHLESVVDLGHVIQLSDEEMTKTLRKFGSDIEKAQIIPAIYIGERGGALVDAVVTREGVDVKSLLLLHEFVHRAAAQGEIQKNKEPFDEQMYQILDFPKEEREKMKRNSLEEYQAELENRKVVMRIFNEGITQWATLYLANKVEQFNPPITEEVYADEVSAIIESFQSSLSHRGLSTDQVEDLMLDLALTGDFSKIRSALSVSEDRKQDGYSSDFYTCLLLGSVRDNYVLKTLDRAFGQ